ncbi:MAG: RloB family protein [Candidatus Methanoperedens sp.]|nr:RloB family protein [Candidatus Methanoperedens sp.]
MGRYGHRKIVKRRPYKLFLIVCEGEKTEPMYFKRYRKRHCNLIIKTPESKSTDPVNLVKFAKEQIKKEELDLKTGDAIWCVFDCDENTNENMSRAIKIAGKDVNICLSNPSFELWFLLHFTSIVSKLFRSEVIEKLKKEIPDYEKNKDVYDLLVNKREIALKNAKKLIELHKKNGINLISVESNPSTQVCFIAEEILKITECSN